MGSIGGVSFLRIRGAVNPGNMETLREITRPGVDGVAYRKEGQKGIPSNLETSADFASNAAAKAHVVACQEMVGGVYSITDDLGNTWDNFVILKVIHRTTDKMLSRQGGGGSGSGYLVRMLWTVRASEAE